MSRPSNDMYALVEDDDCTETVPAEVLFAIDNVECSKINGDAKVHLETGTLKGLLNVEGDKTHCLLIIDEFQVVLSDSVPATRVFNHNYVFPQETFCYGITLPEDTDPELVDKLETCLLDNGQFMVYSKEIDLKLADKVGLCCLVDIFLP